MYKNKISALINTIRNKIMNEKIPENFSVNINLCLDLIKDCVKREVFFLTLVQLRIFRNLIHSLIKETYLLPIYVLLVNKSNLLKKLNKQNHPDANSERQRLQKAISKLCGEIGIDDKTPHLGQKISRLDRIEKLYNQSPTYLGNGIVDTDMTRLIFSPHELVLLSDLEQKVKLYVREHLIFEDDKKEVLTKCDIFCNSGVHKNNYDSEDFLNNPDFNEKDAHVLFDILDMYSSILFVFMKKEDAH